MSTIRFRVEGKVQGVSFRVFTADAAHQLNVGGWVQNERDGSVTGLAHGSETTLDSFISAIRKGPGGGRVDRLEITADTATAPIPFEIRR